MVSGGRVEFSSPGQYYNKYMLFLYPRYEVYRGYIVFAFSVIMFVGLSVGLSVNFFFPSKISQQLLGLGF